MMQSTTAAARITRAFSAASLPVARNILVVDDEENLRNAMSKFLRARGFDVSSAEDGARALDLLQHTAFDGMLCDVRMPEMSGLEVVPRALELSPDLAIVMLTAVNDAPTATEALAQGAMDYLMKPVELPDLAAAIDRALHKRELLIQQRHVERMIREEVAQRTEELEHEKRVLAETSIGIVRTLVNVQEAKDMYLRGHSQRVAALAATVAASLGLSDDDVEDIRLAGQLHDIGEIGVAESLSKKPGPLTDEERQHLREHVRIGVEILQPLPQLDRVLPYVQDHHENWDGSGYPRGIQGEAISLGGRIVHAVDAYDAVTSRRAYREPKTPEEAIDYLSLLSGSKFDPDVFEAMRPVVLRRKSLHFIDEVP